MGQAQGSPYVSQPIVDRDLEDGETDGIETQTSTAKRGSKRTHDDDDTKASSSDDAKSLLGLKFGACGMQGWRLGMEDAHIAECNFDVRHNLSLFAVFDGHGGAEVARFAKKHLGPVLKRTKFYKDGNYAAALREAFFSIDALMRTPAGFAELETIKKTYEKAQEQINEEHEAKVAAQEEDGDDAGDDVDDEDGDDDEDDVDGAKPDLLERVQNILPPEELAKMMQNAIAKHSGPDDDDDDADVNPPSNDDDADQSDDGSDSEDDEDEDEDDDEDFDDRPGYGSGATAVALIIDRNTNKVYCANAGDSRAVLCRDSEAIALSHDHKPEDVVERTRVYKAGGYITDEGRINDNLNLSRAIGDMHYKANPNLAQHEQLISAQADLIEAQLHPGRDQFIVMMCDGITGSMTDQQVVDEFETLLPESKTLSEACGDICELCVAEDEMSNGGEGLDNETLMVIKIMATKADEQSQTRLLRPRKVKLPDGVPKPAPSKSNTASSNKGTKRAKTSK